MSGANLIARAREIQGELHAEFKALQRLGLEIEDYEQRGRYIYFFKSGTRIKAKDVFSSHISDIREMNLYVHLPFCINRCAFCCCFNVGRQPEATVEQYINTLKREVELLTRTSRFENAAIRYIYLGGGTPTYLAARQLGDLIGYLRSKLNVLPDAGFTCETSPETMIGTPGKERLQALLENGVNRLSMGVQSFDDNILKLIGRKHSAKAAISAYRNSCEAGFENINIDLLFGLPEQTPQKWETDLKVATELNPGWISMYRLRIENSKMHEKFIREASLFPDKESVLLMHIMGIEKLTDTGYQQAVAPHIFLLPSKLQFIPRHYEGEEELGLGVSARSYLGGVRYDNFFNLKSYMMSVDKGQLPISFAGKYSRRQQMEREAVLMFRGPKGVNRGIFSARFGLDFDEAFGECLAVLKKAGMITDNGETLRLSKKGLLFSVEVLKQFYSQDAVSRFKNMIYNNKSLKGLFLGKKYSRAGNVVSNILKTVAGYAK
jgi:oxygen-independent coproporphyrinogen-3 oxidase